MFKCKLSMPPLLAGGDAIPRDVQASLVAALFAQHGSLWASFFAIAMTAFSVSWSLKQLWPLWWLAASIPLFIYRFVLSWYYQRSPTGNLRAWTMAFGGGAWGIALLWSIAGVFAELSEDCFIRFTVLSVEASFISAAMARNHASPATAIGTIVIAAVPLFITAIVCPLPIVLIFSSLAAINALAAVATVRHRSQQTLQTLLAVQMQTELLQRLETANLLLATMSNTDSMTQLLNRRGFDEALANNWKACMQSNSPLGVLLVDVDLFKQFNDRYGHIAGDDCLRQTAAAVDGAVRTQNDITARYGGEEFSVILPVAKGLEAWAIAERLRQAVEMLAIPHDGSPYGRVTVSVGMAWVVPSEAVSATDLLLQADKSLYSAKALGRNIVGWTDKTPELQLT